MFIYIYIIIFIIIIYNNNISIYKDDVMIMIPHTDTIINGLERGRGRERDRLSESVQD